MKNVRANALPWLAGSLLAAAGVTCVRVLAPSFAPPFGPVLAVAGQLLALGGLFIICLGVRRRIKQAAE